MRAHCFWPKMSPCASGRDRRKRPLPALPRHAIAGIIGPNGAGKTRYSMCFRALHAPGRRNRPDGMNIQGLKPYGICRLGMARTFQNIRLSPQMTVLEKYHGWLPCAQKLPLVDGSSRLSLLQGGSRPQGTKGARLAERVALSDQLNEQAGSLPYGPSAGWKSPAPWQPSQGCFCWTNRPPA